MTVFTDVFSGTNLTPSETSYAAFTLSTDIVLSWPTESSAAENFAAAIMGITASVPSKSLILPNARQVSPGQTVLIQSLGAQTFSVKGATGTTLAAPTSGSVWQFYLADNTTEGGTWRAFGYGSSTSVASAGMLAGNGLQASGVTLQQSMPAASINSDYSAGAPDRASTLVWTGASGMLTLPDPTAADIGDGWFLAVANQGSGAFTVDPAGGPTIDGQATKVFNPGESASIFTDGLNYFTVGFGQSSTFVFDYTSIATPGTGDYTLAGGELNRVAYRFTGILTGNRNIIVPATIQQYWVTNATTGAFTLTVKTAAGTGIDVVQSSASILYCDGTNVVQADTSGVTSPVSIAGGGTGATTASAARVNLGGTSIGIALFTAANTTAAQAAIGTILEVDGGTF